MAAPGGGGPGGGGGGSGNNPDPKVAEALAKQMASTRDAARAVTASFEDQLKVITQLRDAMSQINKDMESMCNPTNNALAPENWDKTAESVKKSTDATKGAAVATKQAAEATKKDYTKALLVAQGALTGFLQGLRNLKALTKAGIGFFKSVASGAFELTKSIVAIPFKMITGLFSMAARGGDNALAAAVEEVRDQFGSLSSESSRTVLGVANDMDKFNDTGVSAYQIWGNAAERIKAVNEVAKGAGATFQVFQGEIAQNGEAMMRYAKGLGFSEDQFESLGYAAMRTGKSITEIENDITKQALGMSKAFGVNAKVISRNMGAALKDVAHFGQLGNKEMAAAATYAAKLGVSIDKLTGAMDQTSTFEGAAEAASKLGEQFGVNIDQTALMMEQNPAKKIDILRDAFRAAGKDMSKMDFQTRQFIKSTYGADDAMLDAAFSAKNAGVSFDKINAEAGKNEQKTLSQSDAMHELADSIKRLTPGGDAPGKSIFESITKGIGAGIQNTQEFRRIMQNMSQVLQKAYWFGVKLGKMFVDLFPGVKKVFDGLGDMFDPKRFDKMFGGILKAFDVFKKGGTGKMDDFFKEIKDVFLQFFDSGKPGGKKVLEGFKEFGKAVSEIFAKLSEWVIKKLAVIIDSIADWIQNPKFPSVNTGGMTGAIAGPFQKSLDALIDKLWPAIKKLASVLWEKFKEAINTPTGHKVIGVAIAAVLLPSILGALAGAASAGLFKAAGQLIFGGLGKGTAAAARQDGGKTFGGLMDNVNKSMATAQKAGNLTQNPAGMMNSAIPDSDTITNMETAARSKVDWGGLTKFMAGLAMVFGVGLLAFAAALKVVEGVSIEDIGKATFVFAAVAAMLLPAGMFVKSVGDAKLDKVDTAGLIKAVVAIGAIMLEGLYVFLLGVAAIKLIAPSFEDIKKTGLLMLEMIPVFLAAGAIVTVLALVGVEAEAAEEFIIPGMIAIGVIILAMVQTAAVMGILTRLISPTAMLAGASVLDTMANVFMKAGVVITIATLVGAAIVSSAGIAGAFALAGLAAMMVVIEAMAATAVGVMAQLATIKESPAAVLAKSLAFAAIIDAIANMMGKVGDILKAMDFGWTDSAEAKTAQINSVTGMIKELLNGSDGKGGINAIVRQLIESLRVLSPDKIEPLKAFASVMQAIASMMDAVGKSVGGLSSSAGTWIDSLRGNKEANIKAAFDGATAYMGVLLKSIIPLIDKIKDVAMQLGDVKGLDKSGPAIASIFQAIGSLMQAVIPDMSKFKKTMSKSGSYAFASAAATSEGIDSDAVTSLGAYITTVLGAIQNNLGPMITSISAVGKDLSKLSPEGLKGVQLVGDIFKTIATLVSALSPSLKDVKPAQVQNVTNSTVQITNTFPDLNETLRGMQKTVPELMKSIIAIVKDVPAGGEFRQKLETFGKILDVVKLIPGMIKEIAEIPDPGSKGSTNAFLEVFGHMQGILYALSGQTWGGGYSIKPVFDSLKIITGMMTGVDATAIEKLAKILNGVGASIKAVMDALDPISKGGFNATDIFLGPLGHLIHITATLAGWEYKGGYSISQVIDAVKDISKFLGNFDGADPLNRLAKMIEAMGDAINKIYTSLDGISKHGSGAKDLFLIPLEQLIHITQALAGTDDIVSKAYSIDHVTKAVGKIAEVVAGFKGDTASKGVEKAATAVGGMIEAVLDLKGPATSIYSFFGEGSQADMLAASLEDIVYLQDSIMSTMDWIATMGDMNSAEAISRIQNMVSTVQQVEDSIKQLKSINLETRLQSLAGGLGLGKSGTYTIKSREIVITVNLDVYMDANDLEKSLVSRTNSIIRDRINNVADHVGLTDSEKISRDKSRNQTLVAASKGT